MISKCPLCKTDGVEFKRPDDLSGLETLTFTCQWCGSFVMDEFWAVELEKKPRDEVGIAKLRYGLRQRQRAGRSFIIDESAFNEMLAQPLPTPIEQAEAFILYVGDNSPAPRHPVNVCSSMAAVLFGCVDVLGFSFVVEDLIKAELLKGGIYPDPQTVSDTKEEDKVAVMHLTMLGWKRYLELKRGQTDSNRAFMAMKFGDPDVDQVVDNCFKPAVASTGFKLHRLDWDPKAGLLDDHLRVELRNSRFLVADLTHENPGAYWEAGYAEGLGKAVIYTCRKAEFESQKTHFDTNHHLTVVWDPTDLEDAARRLKATIRATLPGEARMED